MRKSGTGIRGRLAAVLCGLLLAAGAAGAGEPIHQEVDAAPDGVITVENLAGSVDVSPWDENRVLVEGTLGDRGTDRVDVKATKRGVSIEVLLEERAKNVDETDLILRVPRGSRVEVETVSATVGIEGVEGGAEVETVSGAVELDGVDVVEVETVSGTVDVRGAGETLRATSVSGAIEIRESRGRLEASTTSGAIDIVGSAMSLECESVSGTIDADVDPVEDGSYRIEGFSGSVTVTLPTDLSAAIEVETFSGTIRSEFDGDVHEERFGPGASLSVTRGDGDADITVSTFSGSVMLEKR